VGLTTLKTSFDPPYLDGRRVPIITASLFHAGGHDDPARLRANVGKSFQGSIVLGMGFTFDDTDTKGVANPIALMHELIRKDPRNAERIFPYIGGEEVNDSPTHAHHRYVINFGETSEEEAQRWPDLMRIVEERVKPSRLQQNREIRARYWWRFGETTPALFEAIRDLERVLVLPRTSKYPGFCFLPSRMVYSENLIVFTFRTTSSYGVLQSQIPDFPHIWGEFPFDISCAERTYVTYFGSNASVLDTSSQCTRRLKSLPGKKLQIQRKLAPDVRKEGYGPGRA